MNEVKFLLAALMFVALVTGIGALIDDWMYPVRVVQSGNHEPLFILLGLVLGFTMRTKSDEDSISALICAIGMALFALLVGGVETTGAGSAPVGFVLATAFFTCMLGTVIFLLRALRARVRHEKADGSSNDQ
ncbi:hypothetical protein [Halomonas urumqiensis]|nr:hypothetical protein [Halomonas urumqiensis]